MLSDLKLGAARTDVMLLAVLSWTLLRGSRRGMMWAFAGGMFLDLTCGGPMGRFAISLLVVAFLMGLGSDYFSPGNLLIPPLLSGVLTLPYDLTQLVILQAIGHHLIWWENILKVTLPSMLLNAAASLPVYLVLRWLHHRTLGERMEW